MESSTRVSADEVDREAAWSRSRGRSNRVAVDILQGGWVPAEGNGKQGETTKDED